MSSVYRLILKPMDCSIAEALTYGLPCIGRDKFAMSSSFLRTGCTSELISGRMRRRLALDLWEVLWDPKYQEKWNSGGMSI